MCGILLIYSKNKKLEKKICKASSNLIKSRGPDLFFENYFLNDKLYIANSVLSIVGKINQKKNLYNSNNNIFSVAFNGEIYNWEEIRSSKEKFLNCRNDTEILANMHEVFDPYEIPKKIDGMFAYCAYDQKKQKLYFASDAQGEKKLFYYNDSNYLIISSTISSILSVLNKKNLNTASINNYFLTRHYLFFNDTCYKNLKILKPGNIFTYNLRDNSLFNNHFDNPLNWISEKKMSNFKKMKDLEIVEYFELILLEQLKNMIPETKFGSILSGGIDSSLQTVLLSQFQDPDSIITLNHIGKDKITKNINKFQKFINSKINVLNINKNDYLKDLKRSYEIAQFPFLTHDFVGKYQLSKFLRKKGCKVFFAADGVDELFGGYQLYSKINWKTKIVKNLSPYSNYNKVQDLENKTNLKKMESFWNNAYLRYDFCESKIDQKMQASLFTDYFIQAISVGNIGTDIMCSHNGIEPRNIFIQKKIIKEIINIPIKHKINFKSKDPKMILKPLLKKIFLKYFPKKLIYKKQGFSGFPNEAKISLDKDSFFRVNNLLKADYNKNKKIPRELEWKLINLEFFLKYICYK